MGAIQSVDSFVLLNSKYMDLSSTGPPFLIKCITPTRQNPLLSLSGWLAGWLAGYPPIDTVLAGNFLCSLSGDGSSVIL